MNRAFSLMMVLLAATAALPAAAQESGGLRLGNSPLATLGVIEANRGCPVSSTSVTVGINKAFATGSTATQLLGTVAGTTGSSGTVAHRNLTAALSAAGIGSARMSSIAIVG